jgi:2-dehydro-3-deoxyphosphogluconate aldolase / (4S)-4-hydroxy-2-oxoglutarate aldolase
MMTLMKTNTVVERLISGGVIPLFSHEDAGLMKSLVQALYEGGIRVFEFTNRQPNAMVVFRELVSFAEQLPDFLLGVGTVMDDETTSKYIDAGADFIISPVVKPEMGRVCNKAGVPWIPGCATLTEIVLGMDHGASMAKLFPGALLGPSFVSSIRPVVPHVPLMISGGVEPNESSLSLWFRAGASCVGLGSQLFTPSIIQNRDWASLEGKSKEIVSLLDSVRSR